MNTREPEFHLGRWLDSTGKSVQELGDEYECDPGLVSRWKRYERRVGDYARQGKPKLSEVVFEDAPVTYEEYCEGYEFWHQRFLDGQKHVEEILERFGEKEEIEA